MGLAVHLDGSFKVGTILHRNAIGFDIAVKIRLFSDLNLPHGIDGPH